jgi:hypothetical protein
MNKLAKVYRSDQSAVNTVISCCIYITYNLATAPVI